MSEYCPSCGVLDLSASQRFAGRAVCTGLAALFGHSVLRNPAAAFVCALLGLAVYLKSDLKERNKFQRVHEAFACGKAS